MKKIIVFILLMIGFLSFLLLHDKGNEILKPYLASYLENKLDNNSTIEVQHLKIDMSYFELTALLNSITLIDAKGNYNLLEEHVDVNYTLTSKGFENQQIAFTEPININGNAKGAFDKLNIVGKGQTLESNIDYALTLQNDLINNIKINIQQADLASLLQLTAQPHYATGKADIHIEIPQFKEMNTHGEATVKLYEAELNEKVFKNEFNINLPSKTRVSADIQAKITPELIKINGKVNSNLAALDFSKTTINLNNKKLTSDYLLNIPELSKLQFITQQPFKGAMKLDGSITAQDKTYQLMAQTKSLGGETKVTLIPNKVDATLSDVNIDKLLHLLNKKPFISGNLSGDIALKNFKNLDGTFSFKTNNAKTIHAELQKEFDLNLGNNVPFKLTTEGTVENNIAHIESQLSSHILNYTSNDMHYDLNTKQLNSTYQLHIPQLSQLQHLLKKPLQGSLDMHGEMNYDTTLYLTGQTESFGGEIDFKLLDQQLSGQLSNVPVEKLIYLLAYPQVFKANLNGTFDYHLLNQQGRLNSTLTQAQLLQNNLTELIKQVRGVDLTKERYNESHFNAEMNHDIIEIDFKAKSKKVLLAIPSGKVNTATNQINANYSININQRDIAGTIQGDTSKPHITVDPSKFIQQEVTELIKDNIDEGKLKDLGIGEKETEVIKNILGDLFK